MGYEYNPNSKAGYDSSNYLMQRVSSAGQAAATGASIGSAASPLGAAIGAGIGGVGGFLMGGPSEAQKLRDEQLKEYMRRKELGMLGLTPEELQIINAQMKDPLLAQQRQAEQAYKAGLGIGDASAAVVAQQSIARQAAEAEQMARVNQQIQAANLQKKIAEENIIQNMITKREEEIQQSKRDALVAGMRLGTVAAGVGTELGEAHLLKKKEEELSRIYEAATGVKGKDSKEIAEEVQALADAGMLSDDPAVQRFYQDVTGLPPGEVASAAAPAAAPAANSADLTALMGGYSPMPTTGFGTPYPGAAPSYSYGHPWFPATPTALGYTDQYSWGPGTPGTEVYPPANPDPRFTETDTLVEWLMSRRNR